LITKTAVFPGSFDPLTIGHVDIVKRALPLFDKIIIAVGINTQKKTLFALAQRKKWLKAVFGAYKKVEVSHYEGLTIKYCEQVGANYILRGIRSASDFEYEKTIAHLNHSMLPGVETILILSRPELSSVSSTIVREIVVAHGDVSHFVPNEVAEDL